MKDHEVAPKWFATRKSVFFFKMKPNFSNEMRPQATINSREFFFKKYPFPTGLVRYNSCSFSPHARLIKRVHHGLLGVGLY